MDRLRTAQDIAGLIMATAIKQRQMRAHCVANQSIHPYRQLHDRGVSFNKNIINTNNNT